MVGAGLLVLSSMMVNESSCGVSAICLFLIWIAMHLSLLAAICMFQSAKLFMERPRKRPLLIVTQVCSFLSFGRRDLVVLEERELL